MERRKSAAAPEYLDILHWVLLLSNLRHWKVTAKRKMRQAGVCACLIIRGLYLVVELHRKLNVPRRLSTGNLAYVGAKTHIWGVKLHVVKSVNEIASELQLEPFGKLEILVNAQVNVGVVWSPEPAELWSAITELTNRGIGEVAVVGEPLVATDSRERGLVDRSFPGNRW